jgi:PAS domain S-box-containing protein
MGTHNANEGQGTILIVDDTPHNLRLLSNMLIEQGYMVRAVVNGKMALKSVVTDIPDIILLDVNMPGMNGYEVCRQLKQDTTTSHIPVIFISALDEVMNKVEAFQAGGVDYITKPFHVEEVLARINSQLMIQRAREDLRKLQRAVEQSPVSVVIMDTQGNIEYVNPRFTSMTGYTMDAVRGQPIWLFVGHDESSVGYADVLERVRAGEEWQGQFLSRRKAGEVFWEAVSLSPVFGEHGTITHVLEVREDITERKRAEEALQEANEQLIGWVAEMEQYNREITLLNGMNDSLQVCQTVDDAYRTFEKVAQQLFAEQSGTLYIFNHEQSVLEAVVSWGTPPDVTHFEPQVCQAIQQKGVFKVTEANMVERCSVLDPQSKTPYLCIPLASQREVLGVLRLVGLPMQSEETYEHWLGLALMLVDHFAVQLANLRLREQLREQSIRDPLTGLFNRRYLNETLRAAPRA